MPLFPQPRVILPPTNARQKMLQRRMVAFCILALMLTIGGTRTAARSISPIMPDFAAIDAYVAAQMNKQRIPGLGLGIVYGTEIVHLQGFGSADPSGKPVTDQTTFSIGSLTKSFTAVAIMQLVEAGKLDLDAPVQRYLPWFRVADQTISARITLRHLLNHTSGLPRDFDTTGADRPDQDVNALEARLRNLRTVPTEQPLGTYGYSNVGYQVLALVIQQSSDQSYEDYVRQHIFAPLGMRQSFATLEEAARHDLATGYHYWFGQPVAAGLPTYRTGPGNGGLFSSAADMARYLIANLNQGRFGAATLLSPAGIAEVQRPAVERPNDWYAMGWGVQTIDGVTRLSHSGQTYNYLAKMILIPDTKWGVVVLQNSQYLVKFASGDYQQDRIADGVADLLVGRQPPSETSSIVPRLAYGMLFLLLLTQMTGVVRSIVRLRRWQRWPEQQPQGKRQLLRYGTLPLILNLSWALLMLIGLPATNNLAKLGDQIPDFTYTLLASGVVALGWGSIRMVWAYRLFGAASVARDERLTMSQG